MIGLTLSATGLYFFFAIFFAVGIIAAYEGAVDRLSMFDGWPAVCLCNGSLGSSEASLGAFFEAVIGGQVLRDELADI
jgi:hypothetical protein